MMMGEPTRGEINSQSDPESESPTEIGLDNKGKEHSLSARLEPTKHLRTVRKIFDWEIEVVKPILIIGDSNLARIPQFRDTKVQVDSFPGATFYHVKGVLEKLGTLPAVEKVVLSLLLLPGSIWELWEVETEGVVVVGSVGCGGVVGLDGGGENQLRMPGPVQVLGPVPVRPTKRFVGFLNKRTTMDCKSGPLAALAGLGFRGS
ncbi:hypothetical protein QTP86_009201 [Hemibagrus guttatus]|nr:hypothetical protein QTP86_009201 [Hemibagrus guttatus]